MAMARKARVHAWFEAGGSKTQKAPRERGLPFKFVQIA